MVPRRLVPELLAAILHVTTAESDRLFAALRSELTLLEGDATLTVRADLRNTLLPLLEAEDAERVREIDTIAADFWAGRASDEIAAAEAVYHALRIGIRRARSYCGATAWRAVSADTRWKSCPPHREPGSRRGYRARVPIRRPRDSWLPVANLHERTNHPSRPVEEREHSQREKAAPGDPDARGRIELWKRRLKLRTSWHSKRSCLPAARPAIPVRDGTFAIESAPWSHLEERRSVLEHAVASTGRIQLADGTVVGTAAACRAGPVHDDAKCRRPVCGWRRTHRSTDRRAQADDRYARRSLSAERRLRDHARRAHASLLGHRDRRGAHAERGCPSLTRDQRACPGHRHRGRGASGDATSRSPSSCRGSSTTCSTSSA